MNLIKSAKLTYKLFIKYAYPNGVPEHIKEKFSGLSKIDTAEDLLNWEGYEREGERYNLRIGNHIFPHMKLSFIFSENGPLYYVDCHDTHFTVPKGSPDYHLLQELRNENRHLKQIIEDAWDEHNIRIFANTYCTSLPRHSNICNGLHILAIDDEAPILNLIGYISKNLGASYQSCLTLVGARKLIKDAPSLPDLIFCDIRMRGECGYDFVNWFRSLGYDTPIYYVTGLSKNEINLENVNGVIQKPFCNNSLIKIICSLRA